jgi:hypothetical protein
MAAEIYIDQVNGPLLLIASQNGVLSASLALDNQGFLAFGTSPAQIATASYTQTASFSSFSQTASYVTLVATASYVNTASYLDATSIISVGNETQFIEAVTRCNKYGGGIISLTGEIILTATRTYNLTGVKVTGDGGANTRINQSGFRMDISGSGCYFDNVRFFGQKGDRTGENQTSIRFLSTAAAHQAYFYGCFFRSFTGGTQTPAVGIIEVEHLGGGGGWSITLDNADWFSDGGQFPAPFSINNLNGSLGFLNIYISDFKRIREDFNRVYIFGSAVGNSNFVTDGSVTYVNPGVVIPNEFYFISSRGPFITQRNERTTPTGSLYIILADETSSLVKSSLTNVFLHNTASWATTARTASYVLTAQTASYVSVAQTASYVTLAQTASFFSGTVTSASYAATASLLLGSVTSASYALTASYSTTSSYYRPNILDGTPGNILVREHWIGPAAAGNTGWVATTSGTGTAATAIEGRTRRPGIVQIESGTTTTGRTTLNLGVVDFIFDSTTRYAFNCSVNIPTVSDAAQEFDIHVGFGDNTGAGDMTDGVYFTYDRNTNTNWLAKTANNNSRTATNTGVNVQANTWFDLAARVEGTGTAQFYINGTLVATINTNIPQGSGRSTGVLFKIEKSNGNNERVAYIDYFNVFMETI